MKQQTREVILGVFLLLVGAAVLLGPIFVPDVDPTKWTIGAGSGFLLFGGWLVSPDPVGERLETIREALPYNHDHGDDDGE